MPVPALKSIARKSGKSLNKIEKYWERAKKAAAKQGQADNYAYIMGVTKHMAGVESVSEKLDRLIGESLANLLPKLYGADSLDKLQISLEAKKPKKGDIFVLGKEKFKIGTVSRGYIYSDDRSVIFPISNMRQTKKGHWEFVDSRDK